MTQAPRAGTAKAYALCDIGFQGLMHDEVTGNIYQRAREYSPRLARFMQRDPLGYPDGLNTYAAYHVLRGGVDPWGLNSGQPEWHHMVPQQFRNDVSGTIDIDSAEFGHMLRADDHRALHSADWNKEWKAFFENHPNATRKEILEQLDRMRRDPKYSTILQRGFGAVWDHKIWLDKTGQVKYRVGRLLADRVNRIMARTAARRTAKGFFGSIPILSIPISLFDFSARAEEYGTGAAVGMTVLDNVPIVDIALAASEGIDAVQEEIRQAERDSQRQERDLLQQLTDEAREKAPQIDYTPLDSDGSGEDFVSPTRLHVIKSGDTCWDLAKTYLGDPTRWTEIQELNPGMDPCKLKIGSTLNIPGE